MGKWRKRRVACLCLVYESIACLGLREGEADGDLLKECIHRRYTTSTAIVMAVKKM